MGGYCTNESPCLLFLFLYLPRAGKGLHWVRAPPFPLPRRAPLLFSSLPAHPHIHPLILAERRPSGNGSRRKAQADHALIAAHHQPSIIIIITAARTSSYCSASQPFVFKPTLCWARFSLPHRSSPLASCTIVHAFPPAAPPACRTRAADRRWCTMWNCSSLLLQYGDDYGTFILLIPSHDPQLLVAFPSGIHSHRSIVASLRCAQQPGARALVHRQELWAWTGCEFYTCTSLPCFVREFWVFFLDILVVCHSQVTGIWFCAVSRLATEYGRFDSLDLSPPPPLHGLQAQTLFAMHGSSENCLGTFLSLSSVCAC